MPAGVPRQAGPLPPLALALECDEDEAGPPKRAERLAEWAPGEEAGREGMHGGEKNDVEIAAQGAVLEAVVEHGHPPSETEGFPHPIDAPGRHDDRSRGTPAAVEAHLVLAVAPHDDRGPAAQALELPGEPSGDGRLPGPPHGQVADRDDREGRIRGGEDAEPVEEVPGPDRASVDHREGRRQRA